MSAHRLADDAMRMVHHRWLGKFVQSAEEIFRLTIILTPAHAPTVVFWYSRSLREFRNFRVS